METNKLYNECALKTMACMPDNFVDLTITSPPYDKLRAYNGFVFPFEEIARELYRITMGGGVCVWVVGDSSVDGSESGTSFRQALYFMSLGFRLHDTMIYKKKNFVPLNHNRYEQFFEYIFCFSKGRPKTFNPIMIPSKTAGMKSNLQNKGYGFRNGSFRRRNQERTVAPMKVHGNIFEYATGGAGRGSGKKHPAVFPDKLAYDQLITWSNEGDLIYDPCTGSGTVPEVAIKNKRNWIGSEISAEYCADTNKRLELLTINQ